MDDDLGLATVEQPAQLAAIGLRITSPVYPERPLESGLPPQ